MTTVNFTLTRTDSSGVEVPSDGRLRFVPLGGLESDGFVVSAGSDGFIAVDLAPNPLGTAWKVTANIPFGQAWIEYVLVPDVPVIEYGALVKVDPATLNPDSGTPDPLWYAHVDALTAQATISAQAALASQAAAEGAQDAAVESQDSAATSATLAEDSADRAGTSAFNAGQSAAVALQHRDDAESHASVAELARTQAQGFATDAGLSEDAAAASASLAGTHVQSALAHRDAALAARDLSQAYATGFSIGDVTTVGPNDPADALISGDPGTQLLHLTLPSGPATNLTIVETTTGPETPGATGPQGLKGDKGDPGGWVASTVLTAGTNLNDVVTPGLYLNPSANAAAGPPNAHQTTGGHLEVIASSGYVIQKYTVITEPRETHVRYRASNNTWFPWYVHNAVRVDQTAGRAIYLWDDVNNRDQLIYGDTGFRQIDYTPFTTKITSGTINVRRIGYQVQLTFTDLVLDPTYTGSLDLTAILPTGFRATVQAEGVNTYANDRNRIIVIAGSGTVRVYNITAGTVRLCTTMNFTTTDAWPVTLPGASNGAIPNQ